LKTAVLEFCGAELTSGSRLLLKHLLLMRVGVTDLNDVFLSPLTTNRGDVELLDDLFTHVACLEAGARTCQYL
jgi:hypothetical protein